ncbi:unnamed protein product [Didymodactylos carnosus]|uniref:Protein NO VEIN C-terminal domain-containing protein n=2 Tax=Didymodactylos carnosus TaxID=1234261 RepID=A0A813XG13_9BILA|nr:unnamed protein product [Didymodactylos carnosus]CAF3653849.1 unnamed protein product [Didymodactylos carnosus]
MNHHNACGDCLFCSSHSLPLLLPEINFEHIQISTLDDENDEIYPTQQQYQQQQHFDDLTRGDLAVGRCGEKLVYNYLKWKYANDDNKIRIEWLNEVNETRLPYDIKIISEKNEIIYIEVKTTILPDNHLFPISIDELSSILNLSTDQYFIYRVYDAFNKQNVNIRILNNLKENLRTHKLSLQMQINNANIETLGDVDLHNTDSRYPDDETDIYN